MVRTPYFGDISFMRIGATQLAVRGPRTKNKPALVVKTKSVPGETMYSLQVRLKLAKAGKDMRGRSFREVIAHVRNTCSGKIKPKSVDDAERQARYQSADINIGRMEDKLSKMHVGVVSGATRQYIPEYETF